jgi:hypothetical protein
VQVRRGDAPGELEGRIVTEGLFHRLACQPGLIPQQLELAGVAQQGEHAVGDEADHGLVPGDEQQPDRVDQLFVGEPVALVTGGDERGDQVIAWCGASFGDQGGRNS